MNGENTSGQAMTSPTPRELTFGEKAVGLTFNPSGDEKVAKIKKLFTNKRKFFERAISFNKPFALIMSLTWLNDAAPKQIFKDMDLQLLMFDKRMKFIGMGNKITFSSAYFCYNFLPKQIIMEKLI